MHPEGDLLPFPTPQYLIFCEHMGILGMAGREARYIKRFLVVDDLKLLWHALCGRSSLDEPVQDSMFEHDRSAARGLMATQGLKVFKHDSPLGNYPAHKLFDLVKISRKESEEEKKKPARTFADYEVKIDRAQIPQGVKLIELL